MKILIPLDGSQLAESALELAAGLARQWSAELLVVRVVNPHVAIPAGVPGMVSQYQEFEQETASDYLERIARQLTHWGLEGSTRRLLGMPIAQIVRLAREEHVALVCLSSHGRSGPGRWLLGSVAEGVLRQSPSPVLLARGDVHSGFQGFRRVVVPLDGSPDAAQILPKIEPFLSPESRVILLRATDDLMRDAALRLDQEAYQGYLDALEGELEKVVSGHKVVRRVLDCSPAEAILKVAQEEQADLIAMSTHGRTGLHRFLLGSVTERVARHAACPLLAFPPAALVSSAEQASAEVASAS